MPRKPTEGDIFEIPLSDGKMAYGWYLYYSKMGPLIQVFDLITSSKEKVLLEQVMSSKPIFPPIITGLFAAIKEKYWRVIGHQPVINFIHPKFVSTFYDEFTGKANIWFLWDGQKETRIGAFLPEDGFGA